MSKNEIYKNLIGIHSQSTRGSDAPLAMYGDDEQAFSGRVLMLGFPLIAVSDEIPVAYLEYWKNILGLELPQIVVPKYDKNNLSTSILRDRLAFEEIVSCADKTGILSFFDPTESELRLFLELKKYVPKLSMEVNYDVAFELGNKSGFRKFCLEKSIPQIRGEVIKSFEALDNFVLNTISKIPLLFKHPNGTAGEGMKLLKNTEEYLKHQEEIKSWIDTAGDVNVEEFAENPYEHAAHVYIDPISLQGEIMGMYDQLVYKNAHEGYSHFGCLYPINEQALNLLLPIMNKIVIPALIERKYTGPACFDVLTNPTHFMELNTRNGANSYAKEFVAQVVFEKYGKSMKDVSFMFLAGLEHEAKSMKELVFRNTELLNPKEDGMLLISNPLRHKYGSYDVIAVSLGGIDLAIEKMKQGLNTFWGKVEADLIFDKIHAWKGIYE